MGFRWSTAFRRSQTGALKFDPKYSEYFDQQRFTPPPPQIPVSDAAPSPESPVEGGSEYKYEKAFCPPERVEGNPCLEYVHHLIFSWFHEFTERSKKNGEDNYIKFEKLSAAYAKGGVHPGNVKLSLAKALNRILELKKEVQLMSAHVADFVIAKLLCGRDSMTQTLTKATIGYMAPEYGTEGIVTKGGDVYSFGIILMETFTGKKPTDEMFVEEMCLKQWVADSALLDVVDANLQVTEADDRDFVNKNECLSSIMRLALACSAESPEKRVNMQDALATLNKIKIKFLKGTAEGVVLNRSLV